MTPGASAEVSASGKLSTRLVVVVAGMALAACSSTRVAVSEVDVNAAALAAQADIDHYATARRQVLLHDTARPAPKTTVIPEPLVGRGS